MYPILREAYFMNIYMIKDDFIKLGQLLKAADISQTGGEAKELILDGQVTVNGEVETRRGKKIYPGDIVACLGREVKVKQEITDGQ
jgi:ribosome-associated protein